MPYCMGCRDPSESRHNSYSQKIHPSSLKQWLGDKKGSVGTVGEGSMGGGNDGMGLTVAGGIGLGERERGGVLQSKHRSHHSIVVKGGVGQDRPVRVSQQHPSPPNSVHTRRIDLLSFFTPTWPGKKKSHRIVSQEKLTEKSDI